MLEIYDWTPCDASTRKRLLQRPTVRTREDTEPIVRSILRRVETEGDAALLDLTRRLDGVTLETLRVPPSEIVRCYEALEVDVLDALQRARDNIRAFHQRQLTEDVRLETVPGVLCERLSRPLGTVGLYVPAGSAPLPSTVLMLAVPAEIAGCRRKVLCTPPGPDGHADPLILAAAHLCGLDEVYTIGGAQAVAAMAFGTETIPSVQKIFGPGSQWVSLAKSIVSNLPGGPACDLDAGPSEVTVVADGTADPKLVAADLLAQAEHGPDSHALLLTDSPSLAAAVRSALVSQLASLPRSEIAGQSLSQSVAIVVDDLADAFDISNDYGPEHLMLQVDHPRRWLDRVETAGSVFLGRWTPEALGDYCSGTNHVLPTGGRARAYSGLGVADFQRYLSVQEATPQGLATLAPVAQVLAREEGLEAHRLSVEVRSIAVQDSCLTHPEAP